MVNLDFWLQIQNQGIHFLFLTQQNFNCFIGIYIENIYEVTTKYKTLFMFWDRFYESRIVGEKWTWIFYWELSWNYKKAHQHWNQTWTEIKGNNHGLLVNCGEIKISFHMDNQCWKYECLILLMFIESKVLEPNFGEEPLW